MNGDSLSTMCMFSADEVGWLGRITGQGRKETRVSQTRIFARVEGDTQWLAYQMRVGTSSDVAMILPVPIVPHRGEDALVFVDLSGYETFFDDLESLFPAPVDGALRSLGAQALPEKAALLVVHSVGSFEASYVPTRGDFSRLDRRFRLPEQVWNALPQYADWGFAVFKLKKGQEQRIHPMAFRFPTRHPARVFFPTVHVHDGRLHAEADFDHTLYVQPPVPDRNLAISEDAVRTRVDSARARGLVDAGARVGRRWIIGRHRNEDTWMDV